MVLLEISISLNKDKTNLAAYTEEFNLFPSDIHKPHDQDSIIEANPFYQRIGAITRNSKLIPDDVN